ncbi:MAG: MBL fold metallo-hydrolase [Actinomycetia bacterium]|nr:MBL fold metallo-hydrolase [Actinomycetes bacterium]
MRDVAYWPKSFLDEIEQARVENSPKLWALGGPSFLYRTPQTTVWIDPYFSGTPDDAVPDAYRATAIPVKPDEVRAADVVISTHDHVDHCHRDTLLPIVGRTEAACVAPRSSAKLMREWGIASARISDVQPGDRLRFGDVAMDVYPSYDPNEPDAVTFVFSSGGTELFVSGDTSDGPALGEVGENHKLTCALLAFGRTWYMNEAEMLATAGKLRPQTLLPFHWEFWRNHTGDIFRFFELYHEGERPFEVRVLLIGDSIELGAV